MSLRELPPLLRDEPAFSRVLGASAGMFAVPEPARAFAIAGLAHLSDRHPIVAVVPTGTDAERLAHDLERLPRPDQVDAFPGLGNPAVRAGEPERRDDGPPASHHVVAPAARSDAPGPRRASQGVAAAARPARGGHRTDRRPPPATRSIPTDLVAQLVDRGYRREYQVEHRGEVAVRGSIVDVFPSTADVPVRIDLWGDEVDRLTEFAVADQRSTQDIEAVEIFGCRELLPTDEVKERAAAARRRAAVGPRPVGAAARGPDLRRHGVVAAVASAGASTC